MEAAFFWRLPTFGTAIRKTAMRSAHTPFLLGYRLRDTPSFFSFPIVFFAKNYDFFNTFIAFFRL
jgi:hypothetical protein